MQVFIDAWLERVEPVVYIRSCDNGQALFCLKGKEIHQLMNERNLTSEDLTGQTLTKYNLQDIVIQ